MKRFLRLSLLITLCCSGHLMAQRDSPRGLSNLETGLGIVAAQASQTTAQASTSYQSNGASLQLLGGNLSIIDQFTPNNARLHVSDVVGFSLGAAFDSWQQTNILSETPNDRREIKSEGSGLRLRGGFQLGIGAMYTLGTFDAVGGRLLAGTDLERFGGTADPLSYWRADAFWYHRRHAFEASLMLPRTPFFAAAAAAPAAGIALQYRRFIGPKSSKYVGVAARLTDNQNALRYQVGVTVGWVFQDILAQRRYRNAF